MDHTARLLASLAVGLLAAGLAAPRAEGPQRVVELLEELRSAGHRIVYSDEVVGPEMVVPAADATLEPLPRLRAALGRHGLELREVEPGLLVVVRRAPSGFQEESPNRLGEEDPVIQAGLIEEIVVTPDRFDITQETPVETKRLRNADLRETPLRAGETLSAVELLPGVAIGGETAAPWIRGAAGRDVLIVMDGFELYEPFHLPDFRSPVSLVDPEAVDELEVLTGGMSAEYGDRYGGLVRIETPSDLQSQRRSLGLGTVSSRLSWSGGLGETGAWAATGRAWYPNAILGTVNVGDDEIEPLMQDVFGKVRWRLAPGATLSIHALGAHDEIGFASAEGDETVEASVDSRYAWARLLASPSDSWSSETVVGLGRVSRSRLGFRESDVESRVRDDRVLRLLSLTHDLSYRWGPRIVLGGGVELRRLRADYDYKAVIRDDDDVSETVLALGPSGNSVAAYLRGRARLGERVVLEIGARWDYQGYTIGSQFSPRMSLAWRLAERSVLRLSAGRYAQSQRINELEIEDGVTRFSDAQRSDQISAAWEAESASGWSLRLGAYARRFEDLRPRFENLWNPLELFPEVEPDRVIIEVSRARARGIEIGIASPGRQRVVGNFTYTLSRAEDREKGLWIPRSWDQRHAASAALVCRVGASGTLTLAAYARTGWPLTPVEPVVSNEEDASELASRAIAPGIRNSGRFGAYFRLDARYSFTATLARSTLRLDIGVTNLTDRENPCCLDVERDDETGEFVVESEAWTGFAPSMTLTWTF